MDSLFLDALSSQNVGRIPIWFMRQAGRYLPEYRALREKYSLYDLFFTPDLARQVTLLPIERFGFDAAILFSDITVIAKAFHLSLSFSEGPKVFPRITMENFSSLKETPDALSPIYETISLLKQDLSVPLIGFCGAPFTVASYLVGSLEKTKEWMRSDPILFSQFLEKIAEITLIYLKNQEAQGVDAVQIFDSWANELTREEFFSFSFPFIQKVSEEISVPLLFFMREGAKYCQDLKQVPSLGLSVGPEVSLKEMRKCISNPLQGNLDPKDLFLPLPKLETKVRSILEEMEKDPAFIFNLGHGILPNTPLEAVHLVMRNVKQLYINS